MNNEVNNINNNVQPNVPVTPQPNVNQMPTGQTEPVTPTTVSSMPNQPINPTPEPAPVAQNVSQTVVPTPAETAQTPQPSTNNVNPMSAVANLNKDEAMEEALSHTTQYSPFEAPKQEATNFKFIWLGIKVTKSHFF